MMGQRIGLGAIILMAFAIAHIPGVEAKPEATTTSPTIVKPAPVVETDPSLLETPTPTPPRVGETIHEIKPGGVVTTLPIIQVAQVESAAPYSPEAVAKKIADLEARIATLEARCKCGVSEAPTATGTRETQPTGSVGAPTPVYGSCANGRCSSGPSRSYGRVRLFPNARWDR